MAKKNTNTNYRDVINSNNDLGNKINTLDEHINNLITAIKNLTEKTGKDKEEITIDKDKSDRKKLYDELYKDGFGQTKMGRYMRSLITRTQSVENYANAGNYMKRNADIIGKGLFGDNKVGKAATTAVSKFGSAIEGVSKLLSGPYTAAVIMGIDAFKAIGHAVSQFLSELANAKALGLETAARANELTFQFEKQKQLSNIELQTKNVQYQGELQLKKLDIQSQIMLNALKLQTEQYVKSVSITLGPMLEGINQTAYKSAETAIDLAATSQKNKNIEETLEGQYKNFEKTKDIVWKNQKNIIEANIGLLDIQTKAGKLEAGQDMLNEYLDSPWFRMMGYSMEGLYNDNDVRKIRDEYEKNTRLKTQSAPELVKSYLDEVGGEFAGFQTTEDPFMSLMRRKGWFATDTKSVQRVKKAGLQVHNMASIQPEQLKFEKMQAVATRQETLQSILQQIGDKNLEIEKEKKDILIDAATEIKKTWLQLAQQTEQWIEKFEATTNNMAKSLGYTNPKQLREYQNTMFKTAKVAAKFGKTYEDISAIQSGFFENTGRNRLFSNSDYGQMFGLGQYLGDNNLAASYASSMEIFNVGVADSVDMLDEALQDVNRMGLNGRKYTKTLVDNLRLAQKYNFKNGTKSLMDMAKWAENTRFNLGSLGSMLDKVHEGGLEGVITQAAQFQVLGGHAAMNANPIAMMYEAFADPEAYARRMQDMTKGYGHLNRTTGETTFAGNEIMMMQQLAKIQGRSVEEVMDEVRARNKKEVVAQQLNDDFDKEQQSFISNVAEYNKESGTFQVKVKRGNEYVTEDVSNITKNDLKDLMPEKHNERMEDYMQTVVTLLDKMTGEEEREKIVLGSKTFAETINAYNERLLIANRTFNENVERYVQEIKNGQNLATQSFEDFTKKMSEGNTEIDSKVKEITNAASDINNALLGTAEIIRLANTKIASASTEISVPYNIKEMQGTIKEMQEKAKEMQEKIKDNRTKIKHEVEAIKNNDIGTREFGSILSPVGGFIANADSIKPINDGIVRTHPNDVGIFAKEGGPIGNFLEDMYMLLKTIFNKLGGNDNRVHFDTLKIDGKMDLALNGQITDIISDIQNNPLFMRQFSRMLVEHMTKAMNGGRGLLNIGIGSV